MIPGTTISIDDKSYTKVQPIKQVVQTGVNSYTQNNLKQALSQTNRKLKEVVTSTNFEEKFENALKEGGQSKNG